MTQNSAERHLKLLHNFGFVLPKSKGERRLFFLSEWLDNCFLKNRMISITPLRSCFTTFRKLAGSKIETPGTVNFSKQAKVQTPSAPTASSTQLGGASTSWRTFLTDFYYSEIP
jgi:hypothetical protein